MEQRTIYELVQSGCADELSRRLGVHRSSGRVDRPTLNLALLYAAAHRDESLSTRMVSLLLEAGADVNSVDPVDGLSAAHIASTYGNPDVYKLLIDYNCDMFLPAADGSTPLQLGLQSEDSVVQTTAKIWKIRYEEKLANKQFNDSLQSTVLSTATLDRTFVADELDDETSGFQEDNSMVFSEFNGTADQASAVSNVLNVARISNGSASTTSVGEPDLLNMARISDVGASQLSTALKSTHLSDGNTALAATADKLRRLEEDNVQRYLSTNADQTGSSPTSFIFVEQKEDDVVSSSTSSSSSSDSGASTSAWLSVDTLEKNSRALSSQNNCAKTPEKYQGRRAKTESPARNAPAVQNDHHPVDWSSPLNCDQAVNTTITVECSSIPEAATMAKDLICKYTSDKRTTRHSPSADDSRQLPEIVSFLVMNAVRSGQQLQSGLLLRQLRQLVDEVVAERLASRNVLVPLVEPSLLDNGARYEFYRSVDPQAFRWPLPSGAQFLLPAGKIDEFVYEDKEMRLIETRLPSSASTSPTPSLRSPPPPSPVLCSSPGSSDFEKEIIVPAWIKTLSDGELREQLAKRGHNVGMVDGPLRPYFERHLARVLTRTDRDEEDRSSSENVVFSSELNEVLRWVGNVESFRYLDTAFRKDETNGVMETAGRAGKKTQSFVYFLLDPRLTCAMYDGQSGALLPVEVAFRRFCTAVFYIGKRELLYVDIPGKSSAAMGELELLQGQSRRPFDHLRQAVGVYRTTYGTLSPTTGQSAGRAQLGTAKIGRIIEIWLANLGVVCLQCFQHASQAASFNREAALIDAIGQRAGLTNLKRGEYGHPVRAWSGRHRRQWGAFLLHEAFQMFLREGERQIRPDNV